MNPIKDLQKLNYFTIILYLNIGFFILISLINNFIWLTDKTELNLIKSYLSITPDLNQLIKRPWTILTHMFIHENSYKGLIELLTNMTVFYFTGKIFTKYLTDLQLLTTYLIGGLFGASIYITLYNIFQNYILDINSIAIGSSAAVIAILAAITTYVPNLSVIGNIKLKHITLIIILYFIVSLPINNSGGHIAHLGGALYGFMFITLYKRNINTGFILEKIISILKTKNVKRINRRTENDYEYNARKNKENQKINKILDKISRSGYDSLSNEEKEELSKQK